MNQKKKKTVKKVDMTPKIKNSPSSPLLNIIKLPTLHKASSPQMSHRFFPKPEDSSKAHLSDRKPTQSLYSFTFSAQAESVKMKKKSLEGINKFQLANDTKSDEQSVESQPSLLLIQNSPIIEEPIEEHIIDIAASSTNDKESNFLSVPIEKERKSRQKTRKIEKAVETCTLMEDEIEYLRRVLRIEQENNKELTRKNNEALESIKCLHDALANLEDKSFEYEKLQKLHNGVKAQFEDFVNKSQNELVETEKKFNDMKEEIALKNSEIEHLNLMLQKSDTHKNRYAESLSVQESEINELKKENSYFRTLLENSKNEINSFSSRLTVEKNKVEVLESVNKEIDLLKNNNFDLQEKIIELEKQNLIAAAENNELRVVFSKSKSEWREKKKKMKDLISCLNSKSEQESKILSQKIAQAFKPKRSTTLRDYQDSEFFVRENILKLQQKILNLEEDLNETKLERDKFKSSVDYCKDMLESKNAVINILETQLKQSIGPEAFNKTLQKSNNIIEDIGKCLNDIKNACKCQICEQPAEFFMLQCDHIVCSACQNFQEFCPVCASPGRLCNIPAFNQIIGITNKVNTLAENLQNIIVKCS